jgi:hypothetical protein
VHGRPRVGLDAAEAVVVMAVVALGSRESTPGGINTDPAFGCR